MKTVLYILGITVLFSCGKEKVVQLPEISHSEITEITDVSAAYLFYDEAQTDSVELNRKNLIISTNWLINVDKGLSLKQVIPHIKFLQDKKENSSHKNKNAKNYFTCNDTSKKNLGFIEFTDVIYNDASEDHISNSRDSSVLKPIIFKSDGDIFILNTKVEPFIKKSNKHQLVEDLKTLDSIGNILSLRFNKNISFQDYITYKSIISKANITQAQISNHEFLDN